MDFRIFTEPQQGARYEDQLVMAQAAERLGFDAFFRSDHYLAMGVEGLPGPTDSWVTLGALARETTSIRLGTLVTSATFRWPGLLAIQVAQVDDMSDGRVELGLGTGWFQQEHEAYGVPFPKARFGPFAEQLAIITGLWGTPPGDTFSFSGEHYRLVDSPALPQPVQDPIPIIIGGSGATKTPALTAQYAAEFNSNFKTPEEATEQYDRVREACAAIGRDPASLTLSIAHTSAVGRDEAELERRTAAFGSTPAKVRAALGGTVSEVVDRIGAYADAGATRVYFQLHDFGDLDQLDLIAREVVPQFR